MAQFVYLHIGAPKTGSTYLQSILRRNRAQLRRDGVFTSDAFRASLDLRGARFQSFDDPEVNGAWTRLVKRIKQFPGLALISHENLASCEPEHIERAVHDLRFAEVHVVCSARDLARQLSAVWQEGLKNRRRLTFAEWVAEQLEVPIEERGMTRGFWRSQHTSDLLARWAAFVDPTCIHLLTVPQAGAPSTVLWERFASLIGLDIDSYTVAADTTNPSLGAPGAAVLRRLNGVLVEDEMPWPVYQSAVKAVAYKTLAPREPAHRIRIPEAQYRQAVTVAHEIVEDLRGRDYEIVGDLDDLIPPAQQDTTGMLPDSVTLEDQLDAAVTALARLTEWIGHRRLADQAGPKAAGGPGTPAGRQSRADRTEPFDQQDEGIDAELDDLPAGDPELIESSPLS